VPHRKLHGEKLAAHLLTLNSDFAACREFLQMLPTPAWILDDRARFMFINPVAKRFFRLKQDAIGLTALDLHLVSPSQLAEIKRTIHALRRSHRSIVSFREFNFEHEPTMRFSVLRFPIWSNHDAFFAGAIAVPHREPVITLQLQAVTSVT
jgi:hypothetical protein